MIYLFVIGALVCMTSCEKEVVPVLASIVESDVTERSIACQCVVTEGGIEDCGFYYGTSKSSVTNRKSKKIQGTFDGECINGVIEGLEPNTTYYIMGYGMNEKGEGLTGVLSVKTASRVPGAGDNPFPGTTE